VVKIIIIALDPPPNVDEVEWIENRFYELNGLVSGFKIGLPAVLRNGLESYKRIFKDYKGLLIADFKLADIGDIMSMSAEIIKSYGFNAMIAHSFVGYSNAIDKLSKKAKDLGLKLILVVSMSHEGSKEYIDGHLNDFLQIAVKANAWGVVAPATRVDVIRNVRSKVGKDIKILSPGVGAQGADFGSAICNGADYEIIGRSITGAENIKEKATQIIKTIEERVKICRGLQ
jgi:orotidine-5'-phosphate decarboxylase